MYILIGNPCREIGSDERPRTGGSVLTMGATLAGLGMPVAVVGRGGIAERESLVAAGIDHRLFILSERTATFYSSSPHRGASARCCATPGEPLSMADLPFDLTAVHGVILCPVLGELEGFVAPPWFHDRTLVSATGFLHQAAEGGAPLPTKRVRSDTLDDLRRTSLAVHATEPDALFVTGAIEAEAACRALLAEATQNSGHAGQRVALVTRGARGALAFDGADVHRAGDGSDDPLYADIVAAAFLFHYLGTASQHAGPSERGHSAHDALDFANAAAHVALAKRSDPAHRSWPWPALREVQERMSRR
ncbi:MAG: hypothetical protein AB1486_13280 [Planctomycetota bacterium]